MMLKKLIFFIYRMFLLQCKNICYMIIDGLKLFTFNHAPCIKILNRIGVIDGTKSH